MKLILITGIFFGKNMKIDMISSHVNLIEDAKALARWKYGDCIDIKSVEILE